MEIRGTVVSVDMKATITKKDGGTYTGAALAFRDVRDNKLQEKGFHNKSLEFAPALKTGLASLNAGDNFVATLEKKGDFWNWLSIVKDAGGGQTTSAPEKRAFTPAASSGSNYPTTEERAKTQVYIVRQSSITAALKLFEINGNKKATTLDVITQAQQFENWVMGNSVQGEVSPDEDNFDDDIPL